MVPMVDCRVEPEPAVERYPLLAIGRRPAMFPPQCSMAVLFGLMTVDTALTLYDAWRLVSGLLLRTS
jgi:hypothetical protein